MPHIEFSDLTLLLAQIGSILLVSRIIALATQRIHQPFVIAEILAGIAIGPSLLGYLLPGTMLALFPPGSFAVLKMISQLGLILFMFIVGLKFDMKLLEERTKSSVLISHASILLPFALGSVAALWLWPAYSSPHVQFVSFMLFLGASMSVTAFPVLARILSERQLLGSRVGAIAIACAAVDDVTAWCLLAFAVAVARAQGLADGLWTTGLTFVFIAGMLFGLRPLVRRMSEWLLGKGALTSPMIPIMLLLLLLCSSLTEMIGIHALFGAFLFGTIVPKKNGLADSIATQLETVAVVLLLPLFFAYNGLRTQVGLLDTREEWFVATILILIATLGKFGGSALAARVSGLRWREASAIGILMNTRGLMELIVLNIGMDLGIISPTLFTMLVLMALVTTFATSPILQWVYPAHEMLRDGDSVPAGNIERAEQVLPLSHVAAPEPP